MPSHGDNYNSRSASVSATGGGMVLSRADLGAGEGKEAGPVELADLLAPMGAEDGIVRVGKAGEPSESCAGQGVPQSGGLVYGEAEDPTSETMTETERKMQHFEANAPKCRPHKERPKITFDGCHAIECGRGCRLVDGDNVSLDPVMLQWDRANR